jgi:hypothetical protein
MANAACRRLRRGDQGVLAPQLPSDEKGVTFVRKRIRSIAATLCATAMLSGAVAAPAMAQNQNDQDGLVNVFVGDVSVLNDANIGVAAQVAANVCGVKVGPVAVLGSAVDRSGDTRTVCETPTGPVEIRQNN